MAEVAADSHAARRRSGADFDPGASLPEPQGQRQATTGSMALREGSHGQPKSPGSSASWRATGTWREPATPSASRPTMSSSWNRSAASFESTIGSGDVRGGLGHACHRLQWRDRELYGWLTDIGLTPRKSLTLGPLTVPDEYFADFFRGCIDGDGTILVYTDRHRHQERHVRLRAPLCVHRLGEPPVRRSGCRTTIARLTGARGSRLQQIGAEPPPDVDSSVRQSESFGCCRGCTHRPGRRVCGASGPRPSSSCLRPE